MIAKHLILDNDLKEMEQFRFFIEGLVKDKLINEGTCIKLNLVIEEMFTNILHYGFKDSNNHKIEIIVELDNNIFTATIIDDGIPFNPLNYRVQDLNAPLEKRRIGGLGIHLMKNIMDEHHYQRKDDKNILTIKKYIPIEGIGD